MGDELKARYITNSVQGRLTIRSLKLNCVKCTFVVLKVICIFYVCFYMLLVIKFELTVRLLYS